MTGDSDIKDNYWDPLYSHHYTHVNILRKIINLFDLELSMLINQVST